MRATLLLAAMLAGLGVAAEPAAAGERGWSFGRFSAPAGARFHTPGRSFRSHAGIPSRGFLDQRQSFGHRSIRTSPLPPLVFTPRSFDAPRQLDRRFRHPGFATWRVLPPGFGIPPLFHPQRFDRFGRSVVILDIDDSPRVVVRIVPAPHPKPHFGRRHFRPGRD